ncbi:MAG: AAA family ATPase [Bacteroidales bacterium]|nr:AAA family ATPase [Bacteroidales bacterium]MDT8373237.1 AAA family ATPase [Bacteroidales bacterium]
MRTIYEISARSVELVSTIRIRSQIRWLEEPERLICIKGSRGVGKTTLLLQYAKTRLQDRDLLYVSLDNLWFTENRLVDLADDFSKNGGKYLLIDEIHHYPGWSVELKNIYDSLPDLKVIYTGSSLLHLTGGRADLSRRSVVHTLPGLSLREYIMFSDNIEFPAYTLDEIVRNHIEISKTIWSRIKPIKKYNEYLEFGYFPFFLEGREYYKNKVLEVVNLVLESDLPYAARISYSNINKLKQLLYIISESAPFKPNIDKLSERTGMSKNTLKDYLHYMSDALLLNLLHKEGKGISRLTKPEKIYLHHPNLMNAIPGGSIDTGNLRETFFLNQVSFNYSARYTDRGDFLVDNRYIFEIGGKNKKSVQISGLDNSYLVLDNIETGSGREIPLWLFGFLY